MSDLQDSLPKLRRNRSFWGMTVAQFLGAFNDNLYKQLILLWCLDHARKSADYYQPIAMLIFALPFVLLSGYAGYLADRFRKQQIVLLCKIAEVLIMLLGMGAFATEHLGIMFFVLFLMGVHSAFFGPSKYGILPEIVQEHDLPKANGIFQLTTFMAIIFGMIFAGAVKDWAKGALWVAGIPCIGFALCGTLAAWCVNRTPRVRPDLPFHPSDLLLPKEIWELLKKRFDLTQVLALYSLFWFLGGVVQPTVNAVCKLQLERNDTQTSAANGCLAIGIAVGCGLSGALAKGMIRFTIVRRASFGIVIALAALSIPLQWQFGAVQRDAIDPLLGYAGSLPFLLILGIASGLFAVPLQVYLQVRSPADQKGRLMGAMNLCTWIGIFLSGGFYWLAEHGLAELNWPRNMIYGTLAILLLPVAFWGINRPDVESKITDAA
ncbi:MAG: MFS transporter [Planctomycetales bacterium]